MSRDDLKRAVIDHYERQLRRHGPTAQGMDWKDDASQRLRFELLAGVCPLEGVSIHEIAAGAGHLCDFLQQRGIGARYSGSDLSPAMVDAARALHPGISFERRDVAVDAPERAWDVVLCSGLFHVRLQHDEQEWWSFVRDTLRAMYRMSRVAIAFNLMSDAVDFRDEKLYYADPGQVLDFCRSELSRWVVLRHDYPLYEFTVYVHRDPPVA